MFFRSIGLGSLCCLFLYRLCLLATDGFALWKIEADLPFCPAWQTPRFKSEEQLQAILAQPYFYLDFGVQTYVFASQDGRYVIKFYRHSRASHPLYPIAPLLPSLLRKRLEKTLAKREKRRKRDFVSYTLASRTFAKEGALLYVHLNQTEHLNTELTLYDKIGVRHKIPLDQFTFILQEKGERVFSSLEHWIEEENWESAKEGLTHLVDLLFTRYEKGLFDKDPNLETNYGFIGTRAIQLDLGRFYEQTDTPLDLEKTLLCPTRPLSKWLSVKSPQLHNHLEAQLNKTLKEARPICSDED